MKTVNVNGVDHHVLFNYNALSDFSDLSGLSIDDLVSIQEKQAADLLGLGQIRLLVWCGLKEAALELGEKFELSVRDVGKFFDPINGKGAKVMAEFLKVFAGDVQVPDLGQETEKKPMPDQK